MSSIGASGGMVRTPETVSNASLDEGSRITVE
jgi:hypothetical protein